MICDPRKLPDGLRLHGMREMRFVHIDHLGEPSSRRIWTMHWWFGTTDDYPEPQCFIRGIDLETYLPVDVATKDMRDVTYSDAAAISTIEG